MSASRPPIDVTRALRGLAAAPGEAPDAAWRAQLRDAFVRDTIAPRARSRRASLGSVAPWAALAAAAGLLVGLGLRPASSWRVETSNGASAIRVNGRPEALSVGTSLASGGELVVPDSSRLELTLPGIVRMEIPGPTRVTIPAPPGRWFARNLAATLASGEIRFTTGPAFHGRSFRVATTELEALVTGTTLAVLRGADSTCVCVLEGRVALRAEGTTDTVRAGTRRTVHAGGTSHVERIRAMESMKLSMLRDRGTAARPR